jgi:arginine exporter protein ArgO
MLKKRSAPLKVGLAFGIIGTVLTIVGVLRGNVPLHPASIGMALLIGGGVWFLVAWAVATAAADVDQDIAASQVVDNQPSESI